MAAPAVVDGYHFLVYVIKTQRMSLMMILVDAPVPLTSVSILMLVRSSGGLMKMHQLRQKCDKENLSWCWRLPEQHLRLGGRFPWYISKLSSR
jgi:hypothetical protein